MSDRRFVHIIHEDVSVRDALASLMIVEGLNVQKHASALSFFETVDQNDQGCLILDVDMPDMSSADFLTTMTDQGVSLKIVAISAHADALSSNPAMEAVASAFHEMPGDLDEVVCSIHAALAPTRS